jgi:predicted nuclease of restriction endonuclease-like (RecB) superfamily
MKNEPIKNNELFSKIAALIEIARKRVATAVNLAMVHTNFEIGRMIVEDEQHGKIRAAYGKQTLKELSKQLTEKFGKGFSVENLDKMRFFYKTYSLRISSTPSTKLGSFKNETIRQTASIELQNIENQLINFNEDGFTATHVFTLSWSHYLILMRIENVNERRFYEIEATQQNWSEKNLKRQYHSLCLKMPISMLLNIASIYQISNSFNRNYQNGCLNLIGKMEKIK